MALLLLGKFLLFPGNAEITCRRGVPVDISAANKILAEFGKLSAFKFKKSEWKCVEAEEILISLQALVAELKSGDRPYDAHRVREGMRLIRAQEEEIRSLHGEVERRARRRA